MCGITIKKHEFKSSISHRGIVDIEGQINDWFYVFNSLPLSSNNTGIVQPVKYHKTSILFNGEIFNYKELGKNCKSDVHYLYDLLKKVNGDILKFYNESLKWDGFWSIVLINENDLFFFSDPLGKKQMYYSKDGISSEIKGLLNEYEYFSYGPQEFGTSMTNFSTVQRALPGKLYCYNIKLQRAYKITELNYLNIKEEGNLYDIIDQSVKRRLENRINGITLFLSGGLDSNIVLHHTLKYTKDIEILTIENEEKTIIDQLSNDLNLNIKYLSNEFNDHDYIKAVESYEYNYDLGSLMPNYKLFENTSNHVVLTGDGSDELFGGYSRNLKQDTWDFDANKELPFYHNIRLDRLSMAKTIECRSPLMSNPLYRYSRGISWQQRQNKQCLRDCYEGILPGYITKGDKKPLRLFNSKDENLNKIKLIHKQIYNKK